MFCLKSVLVPSTLSFYIFSFSALAFKYQVNKCGLKEYSVLAETTTFDYYKK